VQTSVLAFIFAKDLQAYHGHIDRSVARDEEKHKMNDGWVSRMKSFSKYWEQKILRESFRSTIVFRSSPFESRRRED
jgi:hypothetical protein